MNYDVIVNHPPSDDPVPHIEAPSKLITYPYENKKPTSFKDILKS
jgi:hypothetical protein